MSAGGGAKPGEAFPPEVLDFAVYLGIDPAREKHLLWIAHECLSSELPAPWSEHTSSRGDVYFYNAETDESVVEHPLEAQYRAIVEEEKRKLLADAQDASHGGWSEGGGAADLGEAERAVPIAHSEVVDMALYYDVDPAEETWLLQTVRQAVLAPLPWMFKEVKDSSGDPYYYNTVTDVSQRDHPLDQYFRDRIAAEREQHRNTQASADEAWQVFFSSNGTPYFHNFATSEEVRDAPDGLSAEHVHAQMRRDAHSRAAELLGKEGSGPALLDASSIAADVTQAEEDLLQDPYEGIPDAEVQEMAQLLGLRPSDPKLIKFMRELHEKKAQTLAAKTWSTEVYDEGGVDQKPPAMMRPRAKPPAPQRLVFFSWWFEEGVKKYIELRYDMSTHLFQIILNKTVALKDVKIAGRDGELLQCWDLFVGQKIDVLGKPTTLMQANHSSLEWLEYHARRLLRKALELEKEIMQFKPIPDIVYRMLNTRKLNNGSLSLRWVMKHISMLTTQLYRIKPAHDGK